MIIYYTIICNNIINLLYELPYVKAINHIALCWQIFIFYFYVRKKNEFLQLSIWESIKPKIVQIKKKIQLKIQRTVLQKGRETKRKERRETNREKSVGKEETRRSDSKGVRRQRKSESAIRVMCYARERLFSNILFLENNL